MPGKSKKGGGLESSPVYKKQGYGEAKSPFTMNGSSFKMKGFSGFGNSSPLHNDDEYVAKQLAKAEKLEDRAKKQEEKAKETRAYTKEKYGEESLFVFQPSGKRARKRAKTAREKAAAGSRKAYRKSKKNKES